MTHPTPVVSFRVVVVLAVVAASAAASSPAHADIVIFKDGYILSGKISREAESVEGIVIQKGSFFVMDGPRNVLFAHTQVQDFDDKIVDRVADLVRIEDRPYRLQYDVMDPVLRFEKATNFDKVGFRQATYEVFRKGKPQSLNLEQRLGAVTPEYLRIDARRYNWSAYYRPNEVGHEAIADYLANHRLFKLKGDKEDAMRRLKYCTFLVQAGWLDLAEKELAAVAKEFPDEKEKVEARLAYIKETRLARLVDDIELAARGGRHLWVQKQTADFPRTDVDERLLARVREVQQRYESLPKQLESARKHLGRLPALLVDDELRRFYSQAANDILDQLTYDNVDRLEPFVLFANQLEREREKGEESKHGPAHVLALALSGWLLGKDSAEPKPDVAARLWGARAFLLEALRAADSDQRDKLVRQYEARKDEAVPLDELLRIIPTLPPVEPEADLDTGKVRAMKVGGDKARRGADEYSLQLPPEYHHGRSWPLLVALHHSGETPSEHLARFSGEAARHGFILVTPEWARFSSVYTYTPEEHQIVLDVIRDVRRRFQVDSDRIFLTGYGEGAMMAFDLGLAHPDWFAGVVPISGCPKHYPLKYLNNAQLVPFYVLGGSQMGELTGNNRKAFDKWLQRGYRALYSEYKGRGVEFFSADLPAVFDWMNRESRKRINGVPELGKANQEFQTLRASDNRFYWLGADSIHERHLCNAQAVLQTTPAYVQGVIGGNQINVYTKGVKQVSVWLGLDYVDLSNPVTVRVNNAVVLKQGKIQPSLQLMLEDLWRRGDRQQLYVVRLAYNAN
jgi:dienelactone hydrolase